MKPKKLITFFLLIAITDLLGYKVINELNKPRKEVLAQHSVMVEAKSQNVTNPLIEQLNIPLVTQTKNLSCESAAIKMILEKFNQHPPEDEIQSRFIYNKNPFIGFRGNVDGRTLGFIDYGAYAEPVAQVLAQYGIPSQIHYAITEEYLKTLVQKGKPVIIWVNRSEKNPRVKYEIIQGQKVKLVSGEHVVVVEGFTQGKWLINDPWSKTISGKKVSEQVELTNLDSIHWDKFDHMAVSIN